MVVVMNGGLLMEEKGGGGGGFGGKGMGGVWCGWGRGEKEGVVSRSIGLVLFWLGFCTFGGWGRWEMGDGRWEMGDGRWEMEEGGGRDWGNDKVGNEWEELLWY